MVDRQRYIDSEHSEPSEFHPFVVTDLAIAIAQRQLAEESYLRGAVQVQEQGSNMPDRQNLLLGARAVLVQRSAINGDNLDSDELAVIYSSVDQRALYERSGIKMTDEDWETQQKVISFGLPIAAEIYRKIAHNPDFHLDMSRHLGSALDFALERGVSIVDVFRNEDLYVEFARTKLSASKIQSSVDTALSDDVLESLVNLVLVYGGLEAGIREVNIKLVIKMFQGSPLYKELLAEFQRAAEESKSDIVKHYMDRFFPNGEAEAVEE
jgi:hypothetical protein